MKVIFLIENTASNNLIAEHGLSVYIEYKNKKYLLDAGATGQFVKNAKALQVNLSEIDAAILSHAHYDHSGGFGCFFEQNSKANLYIRKTAKEKTYLKIGPIKKYVGIPQEILNAYNKRIIEVTGEYQLDEGVWLIPHRVNDFSERAKKAHLYQMVAGKCVPDTFSHEQSLVFEVEDGLVVLNSCSHSGADEVVRDVKAVFPDKRIKALIGGFHLMGMGESKESVRQLAKILKSLEVEKVYTMHCTGEPAYKLLKEAFGENMHKGTTGLMIEF